MERGAFWSRSVEELYGLLRAGREGLSTEEAGRRVGTYGLNSLKPPKRGKGWILFVSQFKSPLIWLLMGAAVLSAFLGDPTDASIILIIVGLSGLLGYFQERGAINALEKILQLVQVKADVLRDGKEVEIPVEYVVPGDVVVLRVGDIVPADAILVEAKHLFVNEATLTGESAPAEKRVGVVDADAAVLKRSNSVFMGTVVSNGMAVCLVVATGRNTEYGQISEHLRFKRPVTAFEIGVRNFGLFLMIVTLVMVGAIFFFNVMLHRPILEAFLFSLALAVGLTPQLLPAIITVNLSHGARQMARKKVVIKRLPSIENFGQMNVLCADKTGTVTVGKIGLEKATNSEGGESEKVALYAVANAHYQASYQNPLDVAILEKLKIDVSDWHKSDEIPYDFERKRMSVIFDQFIVCKGAVHQILNVCSAMENPDGSVVPIDRAKLEAYYEEESHRGFRLIGIAYGETTQEENLVFLGFLHFLDPLKPDIAQVVEELKKKGVQLKIITGDYRTVALHAAGAIGMAHSHLAVGEEIRAASDEELQKIVKAKNVFAEIEPNQKERIVLAVRKAGFIVGYLGDGVNDISALHSADVSIAVEGGADAAKEVSDIVLLEKDLVVLREGVEEGRNTFANTIKYVYMATSANFGNMFSLAGTSLFLPFLPLLPKQVLLTNLLTDFPEMAIATDRVDQAISARPEKWDLRFIRHFMIVFGLISSIFDYMTFGVLLYLLKADEKLFQTGWFVESVVSAGLIVLVIRTRGPFYRSRPGKWLAIAVFSVVIAVLFVPFITPLADLFGFVPLPLIFYAPLAGIIFLYILSVEIAKHFFFRR
ncbi:MAG TPA: magnesium-translocating P-type ATPase [Chlamydiales bacterium]|nr:magnesium-translocating P-type ATPase [Chlamydiales bacterium]